MVMKKDELITYEVATTFKEVFLKATPLTLDASIVNTIDNFLYQWIRTVNMRRDEMKIFADVMKEIFPYSGPLYRGLSIREHQSVTDTIARALNDSVSSFSDEEEVAKYFAVMENAWYKPSEESYAACKYSCLIKADVQDVFALDDFLFAYRYRCTNAELLDKIDEAIWENEKIATLSDVIFKVQYISRSEQDDNLHKNCLSKVYATD